MSDSCSSGSKTILIELAIVWSVVMGLSRLALWVPVGLIQEQAALIMAVALLYAPILVSMKQKKRDIYWESHLSDFFKSVGIFILISGLVFGLASFVVMGLPFLDFVFRPFKTVLDFVGYQLLLVALPEEFFFRGYIQSRLNQVFQKRWCVLGITFGPALFWTSLLFAFSHSLMTLAWWHPLIFFPSLVFGFLREKTGFITASVLFHAACNLFSYFVRVQF